MSTHTNSTASAVGWALLGGLVLVCPLVFSTYTIDGFEENKAAFLTCVALLLGGVGLVSRWSGSAPRFEWDWVSVGVVLLLGSACLSTVFSIDRGISWGGVTKLPAGLQAMLGLGVVFFAARSLADSPRSVRRLVLLGVLAGVVVSTYAVARVAGLDPVQWWGSSKVAGQDRPTSTLGHANYLGAFLVMLLPLVAWLAWECVRRRRWGVLFGALLCGSVSSVALLATLSRAAWLAVACVVAFWIVVWLRSGSARRAAVSLLGFVVLLGLAGFVFSYSAGEGFQKALTHRWQHVTHPSGRLAIWHASWTMFLERPFLGSGVDTFGLAFGPHRPSQLWVMEGNTLPSRAHNDFLHILATQGIVGAGALLFLFIAVVRAGWRAWKSHPEQRPLLAAVGSALAGFCITNFFGFTVIGTGVLAAVLAGILSRWSLPQEESTPETSTRAWPGVVLVGSALVLAIFASNLGWHLCLILVGVATGLGILLVWKFEQSVGDPEPRREVSAARGFGYGWVGVVLVALGLGYLLAGRALVARVLCRQAHSIASTEPKRAGELFKRSLSFFEEARTWKYVAQLEDALAEASPDELTREGYRDSAERAWRRAIELAPRDTDHRANLAIHLSQRAEAKLSRREEAIRAWEDALRLDPRNHELLSESIRSAMGMADFEWADRCLTYASQVYPTSAVFDARRGAWLYALGQPVEAIEVLHRSLGKRWTGDPKEPTRALALLSAAYMSLGGYSKALEYAWQAHQRDPNWRTPLLLAGQAAQEVGQRDKAESCFRRVLAIDPTNEAARKGLARVRSKDS